MNRAMPVLALALIAIGTIGVLAVGCQTQPQSPLGNAPGFNFPGGMMGRGMMGPNGMMGRGMMGGYGYAPNVSATPVPANQPIDREVKIIAHNFQFDPARVTLKKGETVKFVIENKDAVAHNFVSQDGRIAYTFLPANATQAIVWVVSEKGTFTALCTYHAGMQMQIIME